MDTPHIWFNLILIHIGLHDVVHRLEELLLAVVSFQEQLVFLPEILVYVLKGDVVLIQRMDKDTTGKYLLSFGDTNVEWYRTARARQTFLHKRTWLLLSSIKFQQGFRSCLCSW